MKRHFTARVLYSSVAISALFCASPALAQASAAPPAPAAPDQTTESDTLNGEIIVTARKRAESDLEVPAVISVVTGEAIEKRGIQSFEDISRITPGLKISNSQPNFGGVASLRGVGATSSDFLADQAIAFTLDGVTLTNGNATRFGLFDIDRVEVLKGPQSLFYGKNTTAGIISVVTADPTDELYIMGRLGYEFYGRNFIQEGVISGPLSGALGARLAVYHSDSDGLFKVPDTEGQVGYLGPIGPRSYERAGGGDRLGARLTFKFDDGPLMARLKLSMFRGRGPNSYQLSQPFGCPLGVPNPSSPSVLPTPEFQNCKVDRIVAPEAVQSATAAAFPTIPNFRDGKHYEDQDQYLASFDLNYDIADELQLSSVTSYYNLKLDGSGVGSGFSTNLIPVSTRIRKHDFTQELRLTSDFSSPVNFMIGGFYQDGQFDFSNGAVLPAFFIPGYVGPAFQFAPPQPEHYQSSRTLSGFGQLLWDVTPEFQLTAGARYTNERKELTVLQQGTGVELPNSVPRIEFNNFTPEITASWKPRRGMNLFVSYRKGVKSGGYAVDPFLQSVGPNNVYDNETAEGFEAGIKSIVADGQLRLDLTGYRYTYKDLQLGFFDPATLTITTANVGKAHSYGLELTASYSPRQVEGLTLSGNVSYNHLRYGAGAAGACYVGQSIAQGCSLFPDANGIFTAQDLNGKRPARSADWTGNIDASYETALSDSLNIGFNAGVTYSSKYNANAELSPITEQAAHALVDAQVRLFSENKRWEIALIGKNLTNKMRIQNGFPLIFTPAVVMTGTPSGGELDDHYGFANDPRTIQLRLTFRY